MAEQEREALARVVRDAVKVRPLGPNSRAIHERGGSVSLTSTEAEEAATAVADHLASRDAALIAEAVDAALTEAADRIDAWIDRNGADTGAPDAVAAREVVEGLRDERRGT